MVLEDGGGHVPHPVLSFEEAPFPDWAAAELRSRGHTTPTAIQAQAWPIAVRGRDLVGIAETGSGKTLAYALPVVVRAVSRTGSASSKVGPQGLIVVPTAELALQVREVVAPFAQAGGLRVGMLASDCVHGGAGAPGICDDLSLDTAVLLATPQRLVRAFRLGSGSATEAPSGGDSGSTPLGLERVAIVAVDEADVVTDADPGAAALGDIVARTPHARQLLLFSATWPDRAAQLSREHCRPNTIVLHVGTTGFAACRSVVQHIEVVHRLAKVAHLQQALRQAAAQLAGGLKALVFCNSAEAVDELVAALLDCGQAAMGVHGGQPEAQRCETISRFREREGEPVLVATSLIGRGHDFPHARFVVNYDMPPKLVEYVHRVGRCGRMGAKGYAMTLLTPEDLHHARDLVHLLRDSGQAVPRKLERAADAWRYHTDLPAERQRLPRWALGRERPPRGRRVLRGDWYCEKCGDHQFASREACRTCGVPRPPQLEEESSDHHFSRRNCREPRPPWMREEPGVEQPPYDCRDNQDEKNPWGAYVRRTGPSDDAVSCALGGDFSGRPVGHGRPRAPRGLSRRRPSIPRARCPSLRRCSSLRRPRSYGAHLRS